MIDDDHEADVSQSAIILSEDFLEQNEGAGFLTSLSEEDRPRIRRHGTRGIFAESEGVFYQGDAHTGVWIIEQARVRTYYAAPSGREIKLAY